MRSLTTQFFTIIDKLIFLKGICSAMLWYAMPMIIIYNYTKQINNNSDYVLLKYRRNCEFSCKNGIIWYRSNLKCNS